MKLSGRSHDLLKDRVQVAADVGGVWEGTHRLLEVHRADFLELSPDRYPRRSRFGRHSVYEQDETVEIHVVPSQERSGVDASSYGPRFFASPCVPRMSATAARFSRRFSKTHDTGV